MNTKWIIAAALAGMFSSQTFGQETVGSVKDLSGTVSALAASGASRALEPGSAIYVNDRIATGPGSKLTILFVDRSLVSQGENAEMVINEYVYNPADSGANAALFRVLKGAFRFLTDQITKLNPEHFQVEANFGTIGIRGCELGFNVNGDRDDVFVIALSGKENILFSLKGSGAGAPESLFVREPGIAVSMSPLEGLVQRRFDPSEINNLIASPSSAALDTGGEPDGDFGEDAASTPAPDPAPMATESFAPNPVNVDTLIADDPPLDTETVVEENPDATDQGSDDTADENPDTADSGDITPDDNPNNDLPANFDAPAQVAGASGENWSWGIWGYEETGTSPNGDPVTKTHYVTTIDGDFITQDEQIKIATGSITYHLHGSGDAAAVASFKDQSVLMQGTLWLNVDIGGTVPSPTWSSTLAVSGSSDASFHFAADGIVALNGGLETQHITDYQLNVFGLDIPNPPPDSSPNSLIHGHLVGPGYGLNPITGGVLEFEINHPNGPTVVGAGGADLH